MRVRLRLQNHGIKHSHLWWIVAQPIGKNPKGRYLEHLGKWYPRERKTVRRQMVLNKHRMRYWLSVGA
jgi:ribosomal protein S16